LVVFNIVPVVPTAQPVLVSRKNTEFRTAPVVAKSVVQVEPPFVVFMMTPPPTAHPVVSFTK